MSTITGLYFMYYAFSSRFFNYFLKGSVLFWWGGISSAVKSDDGQGRFCCRVCTDGRQN
jgi:hypothetical protein